MGQPPERKVSSRSIAAAVAAVKRGYQPVPIRDNDKRPAVSTWTRLRWEANDAGLESVQDQFTKWSAEGAGNIGVLLGEPSGDLVDIDLDHPKTSRLKDYFLPPTPMRSGRVGRPTSHYWYRTAPGTLPGNRRHKMPDGSMIVELRSTGSQTVIPPSQHPSGEKYRWEGLPWGGKAGPAEVDGRVLAAQVALLALGTVLIDCWPERGSRHDAYLALAGGLLWYGEGEAHPFWARNIGVLIRALAEATHDDDGPDAREAEVVGSTLARIKAGELVVGLGKLSEIVGEDHVRAIRRLVGEVEAAAGFQPRTAPVADGEKSVSDSGDIDERLSAAASEAAALPAEERDPLGEREAAGPGGTWQAVDLGPYLAGQVQPPCPEVLRREDGQHLMYAGRVNMLYGSSETAKSWIALQVCRQEIAQGNRALYLDFEDEPISTLSRLQAMGASTDDIRNGFTYIRPEEPLAPMQRNKWGQAQVTEQGRVGEVLLDRVLREKDPTLIVLDGMTVLYALHGLDSNDNVSTEIITGWTKRLTRNGRSTVIIIDHTAKAAEKGSLPIGSGHKQAMVQGTLLQVWMVKQPMPGALGEVELVVVKDRPGEVRRISARSSRGNGKAQVAAVVHVDSRPKTEPGLPPTLLTIEPPSSVSTDGNQAQVDLERSRAAEAAMLDALWRDRVLWAFGGEIGRVMKFDDLMDRLSVFEPQPRAVEKILRTMCDPDRPGGAYLETRRATSDDWQGKPEDMPLNWARGGPNIWVLQVGDPDYDSDAMLKSLLPGADD